MLLNLFLLERAFTETCKPIRRDARAKMKRRRYNALKKAFDRLIENPFINYEYGELLILSDTVTETGLPKFYRTSAKECHLEEPGDVLCHAFWEGFPCWHRATLEIVENYFSIENGSNRKIETENVPVVNSKVSPA